MSLDPRSEKHIATCHPSAQGPFRAFVTEAQALAAKKGLEYKAICGLRSWEEQERLYAQGRTAPGKIVTKARPGSSMHNFGLAIDMGVFRAGKYLDDDEPRTADTFHQEAAKLAAKHNLRWGGHFSTIYDAPHFELDVPFTLAQMREMRVPGKWVPIA
jgi:peptidoglycan L-alanyl-D-glutamate endopeptidase CwlK